MVEYFEGEPARGIGATVHNILLEFLQVALNENPRPARLVDFPLIVVTQSLDQAINAYAANQPFLLLTEGPYDAEFSRILTDEGVMPGQRHEFTFLMDMALAGKEDAESNPVKSAAVNRRLRDAVRDSLQRGYFDLKDAGLTIIEDSFKADAERQRDPSAINPHRFEIEAFTLS